MSRKSLLADLQDAVDQRDYGKARSLFERLQMEQPIDAAEVLVRLVLTDEQAAAIGAA